MRPVNEARTETNSNLHSRADWQEKRRIVVKIGTAILTDGTGSLDRDRIQDLAEQIAALGHAGHEAVIVTSGAKAAGKEVLEAADLPLRGARKQMLCAVGQARLVWLWDQFLGRVGVQVGQVLLSRQELEEPTSYLNIQDTLEDLIAHRIVPVINENDVVATPNSLVGDNDRISAMVAVMIRADLLIMLTDQDGLYTADPRLDSAAALIPEVRRVDDRIYGLGAGTSTEVGTGGMKTKLDAATAAQRAGVDTIIANGTRQDIIRDLASGAAERPSTLFPGQGSLLETRKRRILSAVPAGTVVVDRGARNALVNRGTSLLPAGITDVKGSFQRGNVILVSHEGERGFARGIARYGSEEMERIKGQQSQRIRAILGYDHGDATIHRNDLVLV